MYSEYILQVGGTDYVDQIVDGTVTFLPLLVGALLILVVGWYVGGFIGRIVTRLTDRVDLDKAVLQTPIGAMLGGTERAVSKAFGTFTKLFVFAIAFLAAANVLDITLLSSWVSTAVTYLPAFAAGLLIIVLGFVLADFLGDAIQRTEAETGNAYTGAFATGVRLFLYFTVIVMGLGTMGADTAILMTFAEALSWGLAAAVAIGVGVAIGWGGKDFVAQNIDGWARSARTTAGRTAGSTSPGVSADGGLPADDASDD